MMRETPDEGRKSFEDLIDSPITNADMAERGWRFCHVGEDRKTVISNNAEQCMFSLRQIAHWEAIQRFLEKGTREGITEGEKPPVYIEINDETTADAIKYRKLVQTELEKILTHPYLC